MSFARFALGFSLLLAPARGLLAREPVADPRQWMVELEGEPAVEAWTRASAAGSRAALGVAVARVEELARQQALLEERLTAPAIGAVVQYRMQRLLNGVAVFVDPSRVGAIRALPGVRSVTPLVLHTRSNSTSVPFLGVPQPVWQALGNTGEGVKVGIIDSGIDYLHADFGGTGATSAYIDNDTTTAPDAFFPTARVVGGWDFAGDGYGSGTAATPDPDPMDCDGHGTHVAGTAAGSGVRADGSTYPGPYDANVPFASLRIGPGVAPKARLYALRVFGCTGSTGLVAQALEWAVDPNEDGDLSDHLDVVNLSLGSEFGSASDASSRAADAAAKAGVVVVASAGNSGDTCFVAGSPAAADRAISVAASGDSGVTAPSVAVLAPPSVAGNLEAGTAEFGGVPPAGGTSGTLVLAQPADACAALSNASALAGKVALVDRGTCFFVEKAKRAQAAGAIAVVVVNNQSGLTSMSGTDATVTIPTVLVTQSDGGRLKAALAEGARVTLHAGADVLASFSSRGPRRDAGAAGVKPDVSAPGVSVTSAQSGLAYTTSGITVVPDSQAAILSGTSMSSPHVTGVMALLRKARPGWTPAELKAALMNTAVHDVSRWAPSGSLPVHGPARVGAGRVDPARALATEVLAFDDEHPEVVGLAALVEGATPRTVTRRVRVVNKGTAPVTLTPGFAPRATLPGVRVEVPATPVAVPAGGSATFDVKVVLADPTAVTHAPDPALTMTQETTVPLSNRSFMAEAGGVVTLDGAPAGTLRVPIHVVARGQSDVRAASRALGAPAAGGAFSIPLTGTGLKTGPLLPIDVVSTVSAFELHAAPAKRAGALIAYAGAATSIASGSAAGATIWFGVALFSEWLSPSEVEVKVEVDKNADGVADSLVRTFQTGEPAWSGAAESDPTDVYVAYTSASPATSSGAFRYVNVDPATRDTSLFASNVLVLPVPAASPGLGLLAGGGRIRYRVTVTSNLTGASDMTGWLTFDAEKPGYSVLAANATPFHDDLGGTSLPAKYDPAAAQATGALGVLLLHHHNALAARAEALTGRNSAPAVTIAEPAAGTVADAATPLRFRAVGSDADAGDTLSYAWDLGDGRTAAGAEISATFARPGGRTATVTVTDGAGATAAASVSFTVREPVVATGVSKLLPVVLDVKGVGGAPFTTEATIVSRAASPARALLSYTASAGEGSGWAGLDVAAGETKVIPDVIAFLRAQGLPIPADGSSQVGTLRVTLPGTTDPAALFVGGRTSTPGDGGSFGLFYADAAPTSTTATVAGLQENGAMRSNLAVVNTGPDPVTISVRLVGPLGQDLGALEDAALPAWGWKQYNRPLLGRAESGRAVLARLSGGASFSGYGVLNDAGTSDGSYVPPLLPGASGAADRLVPVVLDVKGLGASRYATELTLANLGAAPLALELVYTATAEFGGGSGRVPLTLAAGEQRLLPSAIGFLRAGGLPIPGGGASAAGSLLVKAPAGTAPGDLFAGARTYTGSTVREGAFGVFYPGLTLSEAASGTAWVHGLQQNGAMRSNLAFVNFGDAGPLTIRVTFFGEGGQALADPEEWTLAPGEWRQLGQPLGSRGAAAGSARLERVSGLSRFLAYGVLNDAATSDGSYLPMAR